MNVGYAYTIQVAGIYVSLVASPPLLKYLPTPLVGNPIIKILDTPLQSISNYTPKLIY